MIVWPEPIKCPIHDLERSHPEIGGCCCAEVKIANAMLAACKQAVEAQGVNEIELWEDIERTNSLRGLGLSRGQISILKNDLVSLLKSRGIEVKK